MPHRVIVSLDLIAGILMAADLLLMPELYTQVDKRLGSVLKNIGGSYSLLSALCAVFVVTVAVVGVTDYKGIVNGRSAADIWLSTTLIFSGLALGCIAVVVVRLVHTEKAKQRDWGDRIVTWVTVLLGLIITYVSARMIEPPLLYIPFSLGLGLAYLELFLAGVKDLSKVLNRENHILIMAGLLLFIVTRVLELKYP